MEAVARKKKLIEVALPLDDINKACVREKSIRHGHPSTLHLWWARRPLAAARAVIFAQMVDDPSEHPELFPTEDDQERERQRLFGIIRELVQWENTTNQIVLEKARTEIENSWRMTCAENAKCPNAKELFDPEKLPGFCDPFAGGGSLPLEAQRLGLEAYASDLNPVSVLINKAMIEIPSRFTGLPPVNPSARREKELLQRSWLGAQGLAADMRFYGQWMRDEAEKRIGHLYPNVEVTAEIAKARPDLKPLMGRKLTVIAWLWARTVKSPNPAFADIDVPLISTFILSTRTGKEAYVEPLIEEGNYRFVVRIGKPDDVAATSLGTKMARGANFRCIMSGEPIAADYIKAQGQAHRMGTRLIAIIAEGPRGRVYLSPQLEHALVASQAVPTWKPDVALPNDPRSFWTVQYGLTQFSDLFTSRQLLALSTFADLLKEVRRKARSDAHGAGLADDHKPLDNAGAGADAYGEAVSVYLAFALSKVTDLANTIVTWRSDRESAYHLFSRQTIPMAWDYCELNTLLTGTGTFLGAVQWTAESIEGVAAGGGSSALGCATQLDAKIQTLSLGKVVSTDPPYYDNVPYADLSDFFYVWLRRSLSDVYSELFSTIAVPKLEELVASPYRHGGKVLAERFFLDGMTEAMHRLAEQSHPAFPTTIYYAFKQSETDAKDGTVSTGWETFLEALIRAGFDISGTWPMRTELGNRMVGKGTNALASSIVLVCHPRPLKAPVATRRTFLDVLKRELPVALANLQRENIAPVDLAQAAIGPGMAVFTGFAKVLDSEGRQLVVRDALSLINDVLDEVMAEQEGDFDAQSRFAISWFEQFGFEDGEFGIADVLSRAKNTSVLSLTEAGIAVSRGGKLRLLRPNELVALSDPTSDLGLTTWEIVHHVIRALEADGESAASSLVSKAGSKAEVARELAYRLYTIAERRKWSGEALSYNSLVQSWPEIVRLSREVRSVRPVQTDLLGAL
jgi:putative DNA methylase